MRKHTLLATVAALSLLGATGIAAAQGQMQGGGAGAPSAAPKAETAPAAKEPAAREPAAKQPAQAQTNAPKQAQDKAADKPADNKAAEKPASASDSKSAQKPADEKKDSAQKPASDNKASTTGSAGGSAKAAAPPAEKRAQISAAFKQEKIKSVTNVNFNISVGTRVPRTVEFYPIPARIIEIYPEWRGYKVILVSGRYIIVQPETYEIVYIIEV